MIPAILRTDPAIPVAVKARHRLLAEEGEGLFEHCCSGEVNQHTINRIWERKPTIQIMITRFRRHIHSTLHGRTITITEMIERRNQR